MSPKKLERRLAAEARRKHLTGRRRGAYIYGTINKLKKRRRSR